MRQQASHFHPTAIKISCTLRNRYSVTRSHDMIHQSNLIQQLPYPLQNEKDHIPFQRRVKHLIILFTVAKTSTTT